MVEREIPSLTNHKSADLHIHSSESDGIAKPQELVDIAVEKGLTAMSITDHDRFFPSEIAFNYAQNNRLPIEIVPGSEISTREGHLLVYNIIGGINSGESVEETIRAVHNKEGLVVAAHPGLSFVSSLSFGSILKVINSPDPEIYFDGIEVINGSGRRLQRLDLTGIVFRNTQEEIQKLYDPEVIIISKVGAILAGSDSHTKRLGDVATLYSEDSILDAIRNKSTSVSVEYDSILTDIIETFGMLYSILRSQTVGSMSRFKRSNAKDSYL